MKKKTTAPSRSSKAKAAKTVRRTGRKAVPIGVRAAAAMPWIDDKIFRRLIENSSDVFALVDTRGKILYRSPSAKRVIDIPYGKIIQGNILDVIWPEDREEVEKTFALILKSHAKGVPFQSRIKDKYGNALWVEGIGTNYLKNPAIGAILVNYHDITDRKQQETALRENERRFRELFENARLAIFQSTPEGKAIRVNQEFARMFGYLSTQDVLQSVHDVATDLFADPSRRQEILRIREKDPTLSTFESLYRRKDGSNFWGRLNVRSVTDARGNALYLEGFIEDVTKNRTMEDALRESEEKFRSIFLNSPAGVALVDSQGRYLEVNPALCRLFGYTAEELLAKDFFAITHPEDIERSRETFRKLSEAKGKGLHFEKRYIHKDGHTILAEVNASLVYGSDGKLSHHLAHVIDITERKQAEEALRESEEKYHGLFANSLEGISLSKGNRIIDANKSLLDIFGYESLEDFVAIPITDHVAPESQEMVRGFLEEEEKGEPHGKRFFFKIVRKNGEIRDMEISVVHVAMGNETYAQSTFRDVTDRIRTEKALRENEERFRATFENANVGVCIVGLDGRLLHVNRQMCAIFGYSREELEQMTVNTIAYPEDKDISPTFIQQAVAGETEQAGFDKRYIHKDGHVLWGHVSSSLVRDSQGTPLYFISHVQDITDRKQAEDSLRASEQEERHFQERLRTLLEIGNELSRAESMDSLCRQAVELGRARFGFDRLGIWFHSPEPGFIDGSYGTDMNGQTTDERAIHLATEGRQMEILQQTHPIALLRSDVELRDGKGDVVGRGAQAQAAIWDGEKVIGFISMDNLLHLRPITDQDCELLNLYASSFGYLCSRKRAEEALRESEEKFAKLFQDAPVLIIITEIASGTCLDVNEEALRVFGYSRDEVIGKKLIDIGAITRENRARLVEETQSRGRVAGVEMNFRAKDGRTIVGLFRGERISISGRDCLLEAMVDITERKQAEESLARQTEELRQRNLELTRLSQLTERRLQHLAAMRTVDMAISGSFKSELVMNILLEQLTSQLNVHAADILIFHPALQGFRFFCGRGFYSTPSSSEYLRLADSYAGRATQERTIVKVLRLDEKADGQKIFPKISKEGFVSYICVPLIAKGQIKGVMELYHRDELELTPEEDSFLEMLAGQAAIAVDNVEMFEHLQSSRDELQLAFNSTLAGWARALEIRSREAEGETQRGADLAMRLAQMMGESENDTTHIYRGAILHDVGMIAVPDAILLKPGPLTDEEWTVVRRHPQIAFDILSPVLFLRPALDVPHCHHEKWDGSGYPRGLKGEHIPLPARIFAVVDVWDSLRSDRPYRKAWKDSDAGEYIRNRAGKHFDPAVVQIFFRAIAGR
jgi:PAS domain S-box-containing protein